MGKFLEDMFFEHPSLVSKIREERIPEFFANTSSLLQEIKSDPSEIALEDPQREWLIKSILEQDAPDAEFIQALEDGLNELRYISSHEVQVVMKRYALEVQELLESDPNKIVIFDNDYYGDSSETYFAEMVRSFVREDLRGRIVFFWDDECRNNQFTDQPTITFYRFDDSANSGSQIIATTYGIVKRYSQPVDIRIRLVACSREDMGDKVWQSVANWLTDKGKPASQYSIDIKYEHLNTRINIVYKGAVINWGTSIVFGHKIQDNLPTMFLSLGKEHRRDKPHIFRCDEDIRPPYKN